MLFYLRKLLSYISVFFIKGGLSDKDIKRLLGKQIFIYPFNEDNLKPSSYNLTASKCAFIKVNEKGNEVQKIITDGENIVIPAGKTAIIETEESIYVSKWITGTYHSRVKLVNKGLGHIGTTLDPCFFGVSAIALHNTSTEPIPIKVGDSIATLMLYTLKSKSSGLHDNITGRIDDNIHFDINDFYNIDNVNNGRTLTTVVFKEKIDAKKDIDNDFIQNKVKVIRNNEDITDKALIIYDIENPVCNSCINCNNSDVCSFKLLKNINDEEFRRKSIVDDLKKWKSEPWRLNKETLIRIVEEQVKRRDAKKDTLILSLIFLCLGIGFILILLKVLATGNLNSDVKDALKALIGITMPTTTLIIGMIVKYKNQNKGE